MAARDAAPIHIQISRCAPAPSASFPFRIVNFALVAARTGREKESRILRDDSIEKAKLFV